MFAQADSTTTTEDSKEFFSSDSKGKIKETELSPLDNNVKIMKNEFAKKKRIIISGLDENCTPQDVESLLSNLTDTFYFSSKIKNGSVKISFPATSSSSLAIQELNHCQSTQGKKLLVTHCPPDSLLFVGNIPTWYNRDKLYDLFSPYGSILRCFIVCSLLTGLSKGYGFVEFSSRDEALLAKQNTATRFVCGRSLRVDFADNGMKTCDQLQSRTLFVDKLPKGISDGTRLRELFEECGTVEFCQIVHTVTGIPRGFAFVDMSTSQEAEEAQCQFNGTLLDGQEIRVSFSMPCRPGSSILQPNYTLPYNTLWNTTGIVSTTALSGTVCPTNNIAIYTNSTSFGVPSTTTSQVVVSINAVPTNSLHTACIPVHTVTCKETVPPDDEVSSTVKVGHKRQLTDDTVVDSNIMTVYDKPFINQHDQGIPYTHPLKRMRTA